MTTFTDAHRAYMLHLRAANMSTAYLALHTSTRDYWLARHGDCDLDAVTPDLVRMWLIWLQGKDTDGPPAPTGKRGPLAGSTIDIQYRNLKAFVNWCIEEELITRNPMKRVPKPRYEKVLPESLTDEELVKLLNGVRNSGNVMAFRDYCIILMFVDTGVRLAEMAGINDDDLNLDAGYCKVMGKGRKERIVPLGLQLRRDLAKYRIKYRRPAAGETRLWLNEDNLGFEARGIQIMIKRHLEAHITRPLVKCGPHTLRHTFATLNLKITGDLKATSLIMGHTTTQVTERYTHLVGTDLLRNSEGSPVDKLLGRR